MSCTPESLYQLDFEVKTITRCNRSEDTCVLVAIEFLNNPEMTVCEIPSGSDAKKSKCDGATDEAQTNETRAVGQGKKFTFAIPGGGGSRSTSGGRCGGGGPEPVRVTVRLYQDGQRGREELGSGDLEVVLSTDDRCQPAEATADDEHTVSIKQRGGQCGAGSGHSERDIVAVLAVGARAWRAGPVMAVPLELATSRGRAVDRKCEKKTTPHGPKLNGGCCGAAARDPTPPSRASRRQCANCTTVATASHDATDHDQSQRQYTSIGCEINGRKIDLRVRKKNPETCAIQKKILNEAETFAEMVVSLVTEMHGFISNPVDVPTPDNHR